MPSANEVVIAAAGSGKTTRLVDEAFANSSERVLITTYTRENLQAIKERVWTRAGGPTPNINVLTWFEFLLREAVKPYQSYKTDINRIRSVNFITAAPPFSSRSSFQRYYLDGRSNIYSDAVSDLACVLNTDSNGKVIARLEQLYDAILIDEMQDLAGWDLEFVQLLLQSQIRIVLVGDPRQAVYATNRSNKHSGYRGANIVDWIDIQVRAERCARSALSVSHRCNQEICDFGDRLFPGLDRTTSASSESAALHAVHLVHKDDVVAYRALFQPQPLRYNKLTNSAGPNALNFGDVKGLEFERVLIYPTSTILKHLEEASDLADGTRARLYVAVTRAQHSVGIVTDKKSSKSDLSYWSPPT